MKTITTLVLGCLFAAVVAAADLSQESLAGSWMFTRMILDDGTERPVDQPVDFTTEGDATFYALPGQATEAGLYELKGNTIIYTDRRGEQLWAVLEFTGDLLRVNNAGAVMIFERQ